MRNSTSFQGIIVLFLAICLSLWLGISIVTNQTETILKIVGCISLIFCLLLGKKVWILVPFAMSLNLGLRIPGQPDSILVAQILVLGFSLLHLLMRKLNYRFAWTELEFWILMLSLLVIQVYVRNPVGINVFGGSSVGGKGYVLFGLAVMTCLLFCGLRVPEKQLRWILPLSIVGSLANLFISIIGTFVPQVAYYTGAVYTLDETPVDRTAVDTRAASRIGFADGFAKKLSLFIASYMSPISACFKPLTVILVLIAVAAAMMSGFRNSIAGLGLTFLIGIAYRNGIQGIVLSVFGGIFALVILALANIIHPLPPNIQRSLSFLPGTWEERYKLDAKGSTDWRVEMWIEALTSDRWIKNKILGDGLGFSSEDLKKSFTLQQGSRGFDAHREQAMINGDYHSGPVSTIRVVGYIGLIVFVLAQIRLAVHAHRQILRCRNTEWYPLALFMGIPLIYGPFFFVFIFGDFKASAVAFLLALGLLRLIQNNIPLPQWQPSVKRPYMINRHFVQPAATEAHARVNSISL